MTDYSMADVIKFAEVRLLCIGYAIDVLTSGDEDLDPEEGADPVTELAEKFFQWAINSKAGQIDTDVADALTRLRKGTGEPPDNVP